ncbi:MAG: RNB domain-containing ribonuclease [Proteobacteria bacterium]|nr:RNB domain-containing ribonuclease [Pseudomonadota bacterium]MBU1610227.1 RNB domain-containing ribonuclease [Pseudomonadota bacterium]
MAKTSLLTPSIAPGCLVEFMLGDQPQLAWVLENNAGKLHVLTINKRETTLPESRTLPWTGPCLPPGASRQEILDALNEHHTRRGELQASMDIMEIWELAQVEVGSVDVRWFAGLVWDTPGPDECAAMGRALLDAKTHFKFRPPLFEVHPAETVELRLEQQAEEKARELVVTAGNELFRELWNRKAPPAVLSLDDDLRQRLEYLLRMQIAGNGDEKSNKIWAACCKGLPEHPHMALLLARSWGVVPPHYNHLLDEAGYVFEDAQWTPAHAEAIAAQLDTFDQLVQEPETAPYLSIDGASTRDIDDAFHIERDGDGYRLSVALARPTLTWEFGSELDLAVLNRSTSLYLPEGTSHMLPETLGIGRYSLTAGQSRPALIADFALDAEGAVQSCAPRLSWVRVTENATFDTAEKIIEEGQEGPCTLAYELAEKLFARRLANGASVIERPDLEVDLEPIERDVLVTVYEKPRLPKASLLVSEFMILVTSELALWAQASGVPLLHRTQAIALPSEAQGVFEGPVDIFRVVKLLAPAILEPKPKRHAALAVEAYAPVSSPIRRYTDLVNEAQIQTYLKTGTPRLNTDDLEKLAPTLSSRLGSAGQVQRFRPRYWKLLYMLQNKERSFEGVVVEENGAYPSLAIPEVQINVRVPKKMLGDKVFAGQCFALRLGRVDPLLNEIKVAEALEM